MSSRRLTSSPRAAHAPAEITWHKDTPAAPTHQKGCHELQAASLTVAGPMIGAPKAKGYKSTPGAIPKRRQRKHDHRMCRCRHCQGTGLEPPRVDARALVAAIATELGLLSFTSNELIAHAALVGGRLQALLVGHNANRVGWALKRISGIEINGHVLVSLGLERSRVALWQVRPVS